MTSTERSVRFDVPLYSVTEAARHMDVPRTVARRWLRCLVWPEHQDRARRLDAALRIAAEVSPCVERGHLVGDLPRMLARVPRDTTVVVQHSATLIYLEPAERRRFRELVRQHGAHLIGCEAVDVLPDLADQLPSNMDTTRQMLLSVDDRVLAVAPPARTLPHLACATPSLATRPSRQLRHDDQRGRPAPPRSALGHGHFANSSAAAPGGGCP
jgi:hypothetical protein